MTISAVADANASPPSVDVTMSVTVGSVMSAVSLWRNDSNGRELVRSQPAAGFDSRVVTDYECPYEESVTYDWTATYTDPAAYVTLFNETWASTAAWTLLAGSAFTVGSGKAQSGVPSSGPLSRTVAEAKYRVTIGSISCPSGYGEVGLVHDAASTQLSLEINAGVFTINSLATSIDPASPMTIDYLASSITIVGTGGSLTIPVTDPKIDRIYLWSVTAPVTGFQVGSIKVESYGAASTIAETSSPITLSPDDAWLIHPGTPALSFPLSNDDKDAANLRSIEAVGSATNATVHRILGSSTPVTTTTGPRGDDTVLMALQTMTNTERLALRALLSPDIPLLIQFPPSWGVEFNNGFYAVGDVETARFGQVAESARTTTLPLTKVQSPVVDLENSGWSYAEVVVQFLTYADLVIAYDTYADLAANS